MCVVDKKFLEHESANVVAEDAYYQLCKLISKPKTDRQINADNDIKAALELLPGLKDKIT